MLQILILSLSVAADATAVSIASAIRGITARRAFALALSFGIAQSAMAALGWLGGAALGDLWAAWDHWVALALLTAVGVKMIREAMQDDQEERDDAPIIVLAIATSLDALAIGVSLPTFETTPIVALSMIGIITFLCSAAGAAFGRYLGEKFGRAMEIAGGVALILIGIRIVYTHLTA